MFPEAATHKKICSKAAAQIFMVSAQNVQTCVKIFHDLSMVIKTSVMVIKPKTLHVPWLMLLFHQPEQASYHDLCSGYLALINRVHLILFILKQHLLPLYCFTIKQAGLIVIKHKAFSNYTLFCTFAVLFPASSCSC